MGEYKKHWWVLFGVLLCTFTLLGLGGAEVYRSAPPIPQQFIDSQGNIIMTEDDILKGQSAWQTSISMADNRRHAIGFGVGAWCISSS